MGHPRRETPPSPTPQHPAGHRRRLAHPTGSPLRRSRPPPAHRQVRPAPARHLHHRRRRHRRRRPRAPVHRLAPGGPPVDTTGPPAAAGRTVPPPRRPRRRRARPAAGRRSRRAHRRAPYRATAVTAALLSPSTHRPSKDDTMPTDRPDVPREYIALGYNEIATFLGVEDRTPIRW